MRMWLFLSSLSQSVTTRGRLALQLLQIETFCWNGRSIAVLSPFALASLSSLR